MHHEMTELITTTNPSPLPSRPFQKSEDQHTQFITALERYGSESSGEEWDKMSLYLNWNKDEVKLYAYWYMHQLHHYKTSSDDDGNDIDKDAKVILTNEKRNDYYSDNSETEDNFGEWTHQECILFDTLLATYGPDEDDHEEDDQRFQERKVKSMKNIMHWRKIASMIPNKNSTQCWDRYFQLHS